MSSLNVEMYFKSDVDDPDCSFDEIIHYASHFFNRHPGLTVSNGLDRDGGGTAYYQYLGAFLCQSYSVNSTKANFSRFVSLIDTSPGTDRLQ